MLNLRKAQDGETPMLRIPRSADPIPTVQRVRSRVLPIPVYIATAAILIPALIAVGINAGWFVTTGRVDASGQAIELTSQSAGADIRGWMTLQQLLDGFGMSAAEFSAVFPAAASADTSLKLGELSEGGAFSLEDVRAWVDAGLPAPSAGAQVTASPESTQPVPEPTASATPSHTPTGTPSPTGDAGETDIRGRSTIADVLRATGQTLSAFVAAFALDPAIGTDAQLSTLVNAAGEDVSVEDVRTWVEAQ